LKENSYLEILLTGVERENVSISAENVGVDATGGQEGGDGPMPKMPRNGTLDLRMQRQAEVRGTDESIETVGEELEKRRTT